jgi:hypothetical protein
MLITSWQFTVHTTVYTGLLYFWGKTPKHSCTRGQVNSTANLDITPKVGINAPSTKWTLVIRPVVTLFVHSAILTDMIYLYHTNAYLKSISFPWISGRLPVKSHTSTLKVTLSPMFTKVPSYSSAVSSVGLGTATWKHLWTRQTMWSTAFLTTMPKHKLIYYQLAHWKTNVYVHSCDTS